MTVTSFTLTADDVLRSIDLSGRLVVITGPTAGLGLAAASAFARAGADLMLVGRDRERLRAATEPLRDQGRLGPSGVTALSVHPGVIRTGLQRYLSDAEESGVMARFDGTGEIRSPESGAASIVWAATADIPDNGAYIANAAVANELLDSHAADVEAAKATWAMTERLTGERFPG